MSAAISQQPTLTAEMVNSADNSMEMIVPLLHEARPVKPQHVPQCAGI